jgi:hypothetical protein
LRRLDDGYYMKLVLGAVLAAAFVVPVQLGWAATNCYSFHNRSAADVYVAAYNSLSAKLNELGGWDIVKRSDDERSFVFRSFHGLNAEGWRGVSGSVSVKETTEGGAVLAITTRRSTPFEAMPRRTDNDACLITGQIVRYLGFKNPIRCDHSCPRE